MTTHTHLPPVPGVRYPGRSRHRWEVPTSWRGAAVADLSVARERVETALAALLEAEYRFPIVDKEGERRVERAVIQAREALQDLRLLLGTDD